MLGCVTSALLYFPPMAVLVSSHTMPGRDHCHLIQSCASSSPLHSPSLSFPLLPSSSILFPLLPSPYSLSFSPSLISSPPLPSFLLSTSHFSSNSFSLPLLSPSLPFPMIHVQILPTLSITSTILRPFPENSTFGNKCPLLSSHTESARLFYCHLACLPGLQSLIYLTFPKPLQNVPCSVVAGYE